MRQLKGGQLIYPNIPDAALSFRNWVPPRINRESGKLEIHVPGCSYMGPNTDVVRRIAENVKPTTRADRAAQRHDIDYYNIRSGMRKMRLTPAQAREKVRQADNLLMTTARRGITPSKDFFKNPLRHITNPLNAAHSAAALSGMKAKTIGEDIGAVDPLLFVGKGKTRGDPLKKMRAQLTKKRSN